MATPYVGEIRMVGFNFAPRGWAFCNGALQSIAQNEALYALIGTTYGGDGVSTFALPNLQSRVPIHMGTAVGGLTYVLGQAAGTEIVTLTTSQLPSHNHPWLATKSAAQSLTPVNNALATPTANAYSAGPSDCQLAPTAIGGAGGNQPHDNIMPYLTLNFIIALEGVFPTQG